jgi:hypothetical protein
VTYSATGSRHSANSTGQKRSLESIRTTAASPKVITDRSRGATADRVHTGTPTFGPDACIDMTSVNAGHRWLASSRARQEQTLLGRAVSDWQRGTECRAPTSSLKTRDRGTASVAPRQSCGVAGREIVCAAELGHCVSPLQPSAYRRGARRSGPSRQGCYGFGQRWRPADAKRGLHGERRYLLAWLAVSGTGGVGVVRAVGPDAPCTRRLALVRLSRTLA